MEKISVKEKVKIFIGGALFSLLVVLFLWALLARIIYDLAVKPATLSNNMILFLIIMCLLLISFIASILISFRLVDDISKYTLLRSATVSYITSLAIIIALSYLYFLIFHLDLILATDPPWLIAFIFPSLIVNFSLYAFDIPFMIVIITIVFYYIFFIIFIERFYMYSPRFEKTYREMEDELKLRGF